jgi:homoserine O-acetyltransferase
MLMERVALSCTELEVKLPRALRRFGGSTRAAVTGPAGVPVIVALGGISGNRFVCHGETGGSGWWPGLVGAGCAADPARHRILGLDFAADAGGRAAPSTADQARILCAALDALGVESALAIVGASYGGMVALAVGQHHPDRVERLVVISAGARPHPAATAIRELQRRVVALGLAEGNAREALSIARGLAMLTYRTPDEFAGRFAGGLPDERPLGPSEPGLYLRARGDAFADVMTPERFLSLSGSIDRHDVDPTRIACPVLLIGASTDQLVPPAQMEELAAGLPDARLHLLDCLYGHDMFLKEAGRIGALIAPFLDAA